MKSKNFLILLLPFLFIFHYCKDDSIKAKNIRGNWYYIQQGDYYEIAFTDSALLQYDAQAGLFPIHCYFIRHDTILLDFSGFENSIYNKPIFYSRILFSTDSLLLLETPDTPLLLQRIRDTVNTLDKIKGHPINFGYVQSYQRRYIDLYKRRDYLIDSTYFIQSMGDSSLWIKRIVPDL